VSALTEKEVLEIFSEGGSLAGKDLTGLNLHRSVLSGVDLSGADIRGISV
jgi:uncharacterized protein YjbI with pentapeptide repeats